MRLDAEGLERVGKGLESPVLRFFRFRNPTLSYGRLQKLEDILPLVPPAWDSIQRPTGGGIVFHDGDLCFSLCWKNGQAPLPRRPQEQYRWIHTIVLAGLAGDVQARMAACGDVALPREPFAIRTCFQNPVGYDLLKDEDKIVGGALRCTRQATLYQGSLQIPVSASLQASLQAAFLKHLAVP